MKAVYLYMSDHVPVTLNVLTGCPLIVLELETAKAAM